MSTESGPAIDAFYKKFGGKFNIMIVEDNEMQLDLFEMWFTSPFINVFRAANYDEAKSIIQTHSHLHCWVVDTFLPGHLGTELLLENPDYAFAIFTSGKGNLELGKILAEINTFAQLDKMGENWPENLYANVFSAITLNYLSCGKIGLPLGRIGLLRDHYFQEPSQWSDLAHITPDGLYKICQRQFNKPVKKVIDLYNGMMGVFYYDHYVRNHVRNKYVQKYFIQPGDCACLNESILELLLNE
jgi:hypothetical protein